MRFWLPSAALVPFLAGSLAGCNSPAPPAPAPTTAAQAPVPAHAVVLSVRPLV